VAQLEDVIGDHLQARGYGLGASEED
jgi:hypothetical protein